MADPAWAPGEDGPNLRRDNPQEPRPGGRRANPPAPGRLGPWGSSAPRGTPTAFPSFARESLVLRPEGRLNLTVATVGGATHRPAVRRPDPSALLAGAPTRISRSNASALGRSGIQKAAGGASRRRCRWPDAYAQLMIVKITSMDLGDEPSLGPSAPEWPPVHWHRHRSHGAHVCGLIRVRRSKQTAAYARKVPLNRHLLERLSR